MADRDNNSYDVNLIINQENKIMLFTNTLEKSANINR